MTTNPGDPEDLWGEAAAMAAMQRLIDARTAAAAARALLARGDPLGVMFVLGGLENAGPQARTEIVAGVHQHAADPQQRQVLEHHLRMARHTVGLRTSRLAGQLLAEITPPLDGAD